MTEPFEIYHQLVAESFWDAERKKIRVRLAANQIFEEGLLVECSKKMRESHPVGTRFKLRVKLTNRDGGGKFLYSHHSWPYELIDN